ncbi:3-carboxy-cis,cis-muconate cycloisomerase [Streptomyces sp. TRM S81-3]|uniref:3-carboxy-cis,cis-muconate cycloisomerase n=1 Tax=Streptomyces griseicoloratus TaxID=2752516 RepID=A0A926L0S6_9ACTN|nr:3-carboxy-cis,cis-muconate cycloisomerase [Streptomyces griseicoloratus]MBD0420405.1 3-carboxy-cis,cis-muconate cycloisomerase [Streptomyces griseicoloratus]
MSQATGPAPDTGLLAPARAGTPVEPAVDDRAWLAAMLQAEAALARAQARLGTVPPAAARAITAAAAGCGIDPRVLALAARETANPVVCLVRELTRVVAAEDPAAAEYVHRGSTSQDILDTATMLVTARALRLIRSDLRRTAEALAALARAHRDTVLAGRTLALHAVPTTFGLKAAGWRHLVLDAVDRVDRLLDGGLPVSLGGAAGTLAGYLEQAAPQGAAAVPDHPARLTAAFAEETGLAAPVLPWHSLRTPVADTAAVLAFTAGALGKFAVDVQGLARTEVAEAAEPSAPGRGSSSAMPHKRNPVLSTLIRSVALQVPALASTLFQCLTAEDERSAGAWHAEWQPLRECLRLVGGAAHTAAALAEGLRVAPERMRRNAELTGGLMLSERIAAALAPHLGRARAKDLLSGAADEAGRSGRPLAEVLASAPELAGRPDLVAALPALLDPRGYTGAAGLLVDRALERSWDREG